MKENTYAIEIENEYNKINTRWLKLHFNTSAGLVLFAFLIECILGIALYNTGNIELALQKYIMKYILCPLMVNSVFIAIGFWAMRSSVFQQNTKIFTVSLLTVAICFVFYSVHSIYSSLFLIFTLPALMTVVYGNYVLTTVTAAFSMAAKIISELFMKWDPYKTNTFSSEYGVSDFIISISILCAFFIVCLIVIRFERAKNDAGLQKEIERFELQQKLQTDELTAISNRTALRKAFESMEEDAEGNTYIFVMIDLDNFKMLNDTLGHDIGDKCLKDFGSILKVKCADAGFFRFGGDEFCILFKNQVMDAVLNTCRDIQKDFGQYAAAFSLGLPLSASFGIARFTSYMTTTQLLRNTDKALYQSKVMKNDIYIYDEESDNTIIK